MLGVNQNPYAEPALTEEASTSKMEIKDAFFYLVKLESKSGPNIQKSYSSK